MNKFATICTICNELTSKVYARKHQGQCKACATGIEKPLLKCPDCGERTLTAYQKTHHYHCDQCTRDTDPEGWHREVMGYNDY